MKDKLITVAQASEIAGVSVASIRRWTDSGRLKTYRSAGNHRRISRADLMRLIGKSSEQTLVKSEQSLVYFKDIVSFILDKVLDDTPPTNLD